MNPQPTPQLSSGRRKPQGHPKVTPVTRTHMQTPPHTGLSDQFRLQHLGDKFGKTSRSPAEGLAQGSGPGGCKFCAAERASQPGLWGQRKLFGTPFLIMQYRRGAGPGGGGRSLTSLPWLCCVLVGSPRRERTWPKPQSPCGFNSGAAPGGRLGASAPEPQASPRLG